MDHQIMKAGDDLYRQLWEQAILKKRSAMVRAYNAERQAREAAKAYDRLKRRVLFAGTVLLAIFNIALYALAFL